MGERMKQQYLALQAAATQASVTAQAAAARAASLKSVASQAVIDAQAKATAAKAQFNLQRKLEAEAAQKIAYEESLVKEVEEKAAKLKVAAAAAVAEASTMKQRLHDAKCANNAGCAGLEGYCCPTLAGHPYAIHLTGIRLGCCGSAAAVESFNAMDDQATDFAVWFLSMAFAAAVASALTLKFRGRTDQSTSYRSMAA